MRKAIWITLFFILGRFTISHAQSLSELDSYSVDEVFRKVELEYGTLDEDGDDIDYLFVPIDLDLKNGLYEIKISQDNGELYQVDNSDVYFTFRGYFGYGYSVDCILEVESYSVTVYKKE